MPWHYAVEGKQNGPVSDDEFKQLVGVGVVKADTLVWKDGWPNWIAYGAMTAGDGVAIADATAVCAVSGKTRPKSEMLEFEGRWVSSEHKDEFFQRLREGVNLPRDVVYADFSRRLGAKIIDSVVVFALTFILAAVIGGIIGGVGGLTGKPSGGVVVLIQVVSQLAGIVAALAYTIYFTRKFDATPGKKALGLRLLRADGSKLSKGRIIGRYFAEWVSSAILLMGYLMVAFDKEERRALHDRMCDTRVIDVRVR
jgi:uncharacterized RDD family membrane protein YckC